MPFDKPDDFRFFMRGVCMATAVTKFNNINSSLLIDVCLHRVRKKHCEFLNTYTVRRNPHS